MNNTLGSLFNDSKIKPEVKQDIIPKIDNLPEDAQAEETKSMLPNELHDKFQAKKITEEIILNQDTLIDGAVPITKPIEDNIIDDDTISEQGDRRITKENTKEYKRALLLRIDHFAKLSGILIPKLNFESSLADLEMYADRVEDGFNRKSKMQIYRLLIQGITFSVEWLCLRMGQKKMQGWSNHVKETINTFDIHFDEMTKPITTKIRDKEGNVKITTIENPSLLNKLQVSPTTNLVLALVSSFIVYYGSMKFLDAIDFSNTKAEEEKKNKKNDEYEFLDQPEVPLPDTKEDKDEK